MELQPPAPVLLLILVLPSPNPAPCSSAASPPAPAPPALGGNAASAKPPSPKPPINPPPPDATPSTHPPHPRLPRGCFFVLSSLGEPGAAAPGPLAQSFAQPKYQHPAKLIPPHPSTVPRPFKAARALPHPAHLKTVQFSVHSKRPGPLAHPAHLKTVQFPVHSKRPGRCRTRLAKDKIPPPAVRFPNLRRNIGYCHPI